jgi:hypothetical protein
MKGILLMKMFYTIKSILLIPNYVEIMNEVNKGRDKIISTIVQDNDDMVGFQEGKVENSWLT